MTLHAAFYKSTRPGFLGLYNRAVRAFENGPYSHCELVFSDGDSASASFLDHGVRFTGKTWPHPAIDFANGNWDLISLPDSYELQARAFWQAHMSWSYDTRGNVRFLWPWGNRDSKLKLFCSEGLLASLGVSEAWRFGVNAAAAVCHKLGEAA